MKQSLVLSISLILAVSSFALGSAVPKDSAPAITPSYAPNPDRIYLGSRPAILPDGKRFVFEWADAIWIAPVAGGDATLLQTSSGKDVWPIVSSDGKKVAFQSNRNGSTYQIFTTTIDEVTPAQQVTFHSEGTRPYAFVENDTHLLCVVYRDHDITRYAGRAALVSVTNRAPEKILFDAMADNPSLSPDGKRLLFTQGGDQMYRKRLRGQQVSQIWLYDIPAETFTPLVRNDTESRSPIWHPNGRQFYYISGKTGNQNLYLRDLASGEEKQLTFHTEDSVMQPTLSADGKTLIYRHLFDFYRIDPTQKEPKPIRIDLRPVQAVASTLPSVRRRYYTACWNNDFDGDLTFCDNGTQMAFTAGGDLWVMDTVLRQPRLVHGETRTHERECVFAQDGSALYYLSDRGDGVDLLKATRANPNQFWWQNTRFESVTLLHDGKTRQGLSLSPDGKHLAWIEPGWNIVIADLDGKEKARLPKSAEAPHYDWSPDGKWIAAGMADDYSNVDVWILSTDNSREPYNLSRHFSWDGNPRWSPDGKMLAFLGRRPDEGVRLFYVWLNKKDEDALRDKKYDEALDFMKKEGIKLPDPKKEDEKKDDALTPEKQPEEKKAPEGDSQNGNTPKAPEPVKEDAPEKAPDEVKPEEGKPAGDAKKAEGEKKTGEEKKSEGEKKEEKLPEVSIDFDDLYTRVRQANIGSASPSGLFFSHDGRTLIFKASIGGRRGTYKIKLPDQTNPQFLTARQGEPVQWLKKGDKLLWMVDRVPAKLDTSYPFSVYQETNVNDYQELAFLSAWRKVRDSYYDGNFHGVDWERIREKYRLAARHAASLSVFERIIRMVNGELNSSHLGFYLSDSNRKEWERTVSYQGWHLATNHLGLRFDPAYTGEGWLVKDIIPRGPADLLPVGILPGDKVLTINNRALTADVDPTLILNAPANSMFNLDVQTGTNAVRSVSIRGTGFSAIRDLLNVNNREVARKYVHEKSGGKLGYLTIDRMYNDEYYRFEQEVFAEGYGKDGLIIDVRNNTGGFTADRILSILCGAAHSIAVARYGEPAYLAGYWGRPVWDKPIIVLCSQITVSNGEIFTHAIKNLKRGRVVGVQTAGGVIATREFPLLDYGNIRDASRGWFQPDGTDMETVGAIPDIIVWNTPQDFVDTYDRQLDTAIQALQEDVEIYKKNSKPVELKYSVQ